MGRLESFDSFVAKAAYIFNRGMPLDLHETTTYQAGIYQTQAYRALKRLKNRVLKPYGLTMVQWHILGMVADAGSDGVRITTVANTIETTQAFITNTINALELKGYVHRSVDPSDNRARMVALEPKHIRKIRKIELKLREALKEELYSHVTSEEVETFVSVLAKFAKADRTK